MSEYKLNPKHNSLVLYYDIKPMLEILTDDEAGQLFRLVMNMDEDINPLILNPAIKIAFAQIRGKAIDNDKKWSGNSKQGAVYQHKRWLNENEDKYKRGEMSEADYLADREKRLAEMARLENELTEKEGADDGE